MSRKFSVMSGTTPKMHVKVHKWMLQSPTGHLHGYVALHLVCTVYRLRVVMKLLMLQFQSSSAESARERCCVLTKEERHHHHTAVRQQHRYHFDHAPSAAMFTCVLSRAAPSGAMFIRVSGVIISRVPCYTAGSAVTFSRVSCHTAGSADVTRVLCHTIVFRSPMRRVMCQRQKLFLTTVMPCGGLSLAPTMTGWNPKPPLHTPPPTTKATGNRSCHDPVQQHFPRGG